MSYLTVPGSLKGVISIVMAIWIQSIAFGQHLTTLSIYTGLQRSIAYDKVQSSYTFKGITMPVTAQVNFSRPRFTQGLQFSFAAPHLSAPFTIGKNPPTDKYIKNHFYLFRYYLVKSFKLNETWNAQAGSALSAKAGIRDFMLSGLSQVSYEGMLSAEFMGGIMRRLSTRCDASASIAIPFVTYFVERAYGLGSQKQIFASFGKLQGFQLNLNLKVHLNKGWYFLTGYDLLFYRNATVEEVRIANEQYFVGLTVAI